MCFAFISQFYFTAFGSYGSHNLRLLILIMRVSMSSLACFDLVTWLQGQNKPRMTSRMDLNFLWSDPCQCALNVQAEQTLLPGVLSCCIYHTRRTH